MTDIPHNEIRALLEKERTIQARKDEYKRCLPHLYSRDWYTWAWDFFTSRNKMCLLVASNQSSKSSTQIRKITEWAGNPTLWPELWKEPPKTFWYLYPDRDTATAEFNTKWMEFLPCGAFKNHPTYGWKANYEERRRISDIVFNSGVTIYFKTYAQQVKNLQSGTVSYAACDEEMPEELLPEIMARLFATDGYFSMVFTATLNQDFWRLAMEGEGEMETFPSAFKQQVSMRDCITYRNGKPGAYDDRRIRQIEAMCKNETERQRRVEGRFITEGGRKYPQYDILRHMKKPFPIPGDWRKYVAVDVGSGGEQHPPAIVFVALRHDARLGVVYRAWRGDDGATYAASDIYNKFRELRGNDIITMQMYDQHAKDFNTIATRAGDPFLPSEKNHERGEDIVNTLFRNDMLQLLESDDTHKLGTELTGLMKATAKRKCKDDLCDAMRYAVMAMPWDWTVITGEMSDETVAAAKLVPYTEKERLELEIKERRGELDDPKEGSDWGELEAEFAYWNEAYGT